MGPGTSTNVIEGRCAVTVPVTGRQRPTEPSGPARPLPKVNNGPVRRGRLFGVRVGQLVATQLAAAALLVGAVGGAIGLAAGLVVALLLLAMAWLRVRGRWVFEWLGVAMRFSGRRHTAPAPGA